MRLAAFVSLFAMGCFPAVPPEETPSTRSSATPTVPGAEVTIGTCNGGTYPTGDSGGAQVWTEVDADSRIAVHFEDRDLNCCPEPVAMFTTNGTDIVLDFDPSTAEVECDCICVVDLTVTSDPFAAGAYLLDVTYEGVSEGTLEVVVP